MAIFRVNKLTTKGYTIVINKMLQDKDLSLEAKGLLGMILTLPDDWDYSINGLVAISNEKYNKVNKIVRELIEKGYIVRTKLNPNKTKSGRFEYIYDIYEEKTRSEKQRVVEQDLVEQDLVFIGLNKINNNKINNKQNNNINNKLNEFNLYNNFNEDLQCECISKSTNERCQRKSSFNINGINYCNQHARYLIPNIENNKIKNKEANKKELEEEFEILWKLYPRKEGKKKSLEYYIKARQNNVSFEQVKQGINNYNLHIKNNNVDTRYIKHGSTWFNQECWNDVYDTKESYLKVIEKECMEEYGRED